jgi:nucleotide-binding universal stress UspA family protein
MKVLVPIDGSKYSMEALEVALDYAKLKKAEISLISVVPVLEGIDFEISAAERAKLKASMERRAENVVNQACGILTTEDIIASCKAIVASYSVPEAIVDFAAKEKINLIIIGSRGLDPSVKFKLGSVAAKVVKHAPCSVYVVKMSE